MKRTAYLVFGLLIFASSGLAIVHGAKASLSQCIYNRAKYGPDKDLDTPAVLRRCEHAYALYAGSYYLCEFAADRAYGDRFDADKNMRPERIEAARLWCDRGLALVKLHRQLREIDARLAAMESPAEGMRRWEDYVEWEFWVPGNQAVLADLQIQAGDYGGAMDSLRRAKQHDDYERLQRRLRRAWRRERKPPN